MTAELPESARRLFADQEANFSGNSLKIRRVLQLASDLTGKPLNQLRMLDLACGPGTYSIEAALHGAKMVAIDARMERMSEGAQAARELGLSVDFRQGDVRDLQHDTFDVVLILGILYHLEAADVASLLKAVSAMTDTIIIDTHISLAGDSEARINGATYTGHHFREHHSSENEAQRQAKVRASIDNPTSFWFTKKSLVDLLIGSGFTSVMECHAPIEPNKPTDRITLAARRGETISWAGFPWLNEMEQSEIERQFPLQRKPGMVVRLLRRVARRITNTPK